MSQCMVNTRLLMEMGRVYFELRKCTGILIGRYQKMTSWPLTMVGDPGTSVDPLPCFLISTYPSWHFWEERPRTYYRGMKGILFFN